LDVVATEGEVRVLGNMRRKASKADQMFAALVSKRNAATRVEREDIYVNRTEVPSWL
jgi:predicted GNAT family acetyltransferase